jgi:hypothetical protein
MSIQRLLAALLCLATLTTASYAGKFSIGSFTQVKLEYQYTDYSKYTYPSPILFEFPNQDYRQPAPYIADFPENRALLKISQGLGINDVLHVKYQYSDLTSVNRQELYNAKYVRNLSASTEAHLAGQITKGSGEFTSRMLETGAKVDFAGFTLAEGTYAYYYNTVDTAGGAKGSAHSIELKLRQSVSKTTALQVKYGYFFASNGDLRDFFSNTLPTKTALHLEWRESWNSSRYRAWSPSLEIDQYLNWASILTVRARYYHGVPQEIAQLEALQGGEFNSYSLSGILSYRLFAETTVNLKYRYYWSDQDIQMHTYLIGLEHIL